MEQSLLILPQVIAHRGASAYAPENTLAAFLKAKQLGVNWVEFDVQLTADEELVVFHDDELNRTTNGMGELSNYSLPRLKMLDAGSWFNPRFKDEKIPTLEEMIHFLQLQGLAANIELKPRAGDESVIAQKTINLIEKWMKKKTISLLVSSFSLIMLEQVRQLHSSIPLAILMDEWSEDWKMAANDLNCVAVNLDRRIVSQEKITEIHAAGRKAIVFTVNDAQDAKQLFSWDVDAVFSDCPDKILPFCIGAK